MCIRDRSDAVTKKHTQNTDDKIIEGNTSVEVIDAGDGYIVFTEDGNEVARFTGGYFGIGTDSPSVPLEIANNLSTRDGLSIIKYNTTTSWWSEVVFGHSNSNVVGTLTETITGTYLGIIYFKGVNSSSALDAGARISVYQNGAAGADAVPADMFISTYSATGLNNQLWLASNGNVGIGATVTPVAKLLVQTIGGYTEPALQINHLGTGHGLYIKDASTSTGNVIYVSGSYLTTGRLAYFYSNSSYTNIRSLVEITNNNASATGATCLFIDQNANNLALKIDSEATSHTIISVLPHTLTTGVALDINSLNALTTGTGINLVSNSSSSSSRNLFKILNDNTAATGTTCLTIDSDAGRGLYIDHTGGGYGLEIKFNAQTNGHGIYIRSDYGPGTANHGLFMIEQNGSATTGTMFYINQEHPSSSMVCVKLKQDSSANALDISCGAGEAIDISCGGRGLRIVSTTPTANALRVEANSLTTGNLAVFESNSGDNSTRWMVFINNENPAADNAICLYIKQDGADYCLYANGYHIDADGTGHDSSSRTLKSEFEDMTVLDKINDVLTQKYRYNIWKEKNIEKRSFSPCAEDFHRSFGLGDNTSIAPKDLAGVAFKGVQELLLEVENLKKEIIELKSK